MADPPPVSGASSTFSAPAAGIQPVEAWAPGPAAAVPAVLHCLGYDDVLEHLAAQGMGRNLAGFLDSQEVGG